MSFDWSQTYELITITIPINKDDKFQCNFYNNYIEIFVNDQLVVGGKDKELFLSIYPKESTWYVDDNILYIELIKVDDRESQWWNKLFKSDPNPARIYRPFRPFAECSDEAKLMFRDSHKFNIENLEKQKKENNEN